METQTPNTDWNCPICLTTDNYPFVINCGHSICKVCLDKIDICCICKAAITTKEIPNYELGKILNLINQQISPSNDDTTNDKIIAELLQKEIYEISIDIPDNSVKKSERTAVKKHEESQEEEETEDEIEEEEPEEESEEDEVPKRKLPIFMPRNMRLNQQRRARERLNENSSNNIIEQPIPQPVTIQQPVQQPVQSCIINKKVKYNTICCILISTAIVVAYFGTDAMVKIHAKNTYTKIIESCNVYQCDNTPALCRYSEICPIITLYYGSTKYNTTTSYQLDEPYFNYCDTHQYMECYYIAEDITTLTLNEIKLNLHHPDGGEIALGFFLGFFYLIFLCLFLSYLITTNWCYSKC